jgi:hypothetical protein
MHLRSATVPGRSNVGVAKGLDLGGRIGVTVWFAARQSDQSFTNTIAVGCLFVCSFSLQFQAVSLLRMGSRTVAANVEVGTERCRTLTRRLREFGWLSRQLMCAWFALRRELIPHDPLDDSSRKAVPVAIGSFRDFGLSQDLLNRVIVDSWCQFFAFHTR